MLSEVVGSSALSRVKSTAAIAAITAQALALFDRKGFDQTTVDEIAQASGISTRTFFRYFRNKEEVVVGTHAAFGPLVTEALRSRPSSESIWISLRRSFDVLAEEIERDPSSAAQVLRIIASTTILRVHSLEKHIAWSESLIPEVASRIDSDDPIVAGSLVHSALSCLEVALSGFASASASETVHGLLDRAFDANMKYCRPDI